MDGPALTATRKLPRPASKPPASVKDQVSTALAFFERNASKKYRDDMAPRYGIVTDKAFGVSMADIQKLAKTLGRNHDLAEALWQTGWYEARMLTAYVAEPARVTPAQMDRWAKDFDNWGICDTLCFALFDRTPHAWAKVEKWSASRHEFVKRAAFALLASIALHDKTAGDEKFLESLSLIESAATDERNFVKKGVNWALRAIGNRRSPKLKAAAMTLAKRLAESSDPTARWIGKDAVRQMSKRAARGERS
jgi:3-methyladenine DNA glycosylase AlkD